MSEATNSTEKLTDEFVADPAFDAGDDGFKLPDPDIEYEDDEAFPRTPEFLEAQRKASTQQYDHTMFESWRVVLQQFVMVAEHGITLPLADGILRQWPWLRYADLTSYLQYRAVYLKEAIRVLEAQFPKPEAELFQEAEDDFIRHKESYIDVIVAWTRLTNRWVDIWDKVDPKSQSKKGVLHAVTSDLSALLINKELGLIENLRNLHGFNENMTEEDGQELIARINAPTDETDVR
ncbi:hypothetical protein HWC33_gp46 [Microbacterium phage TinyTimothy]|uniref:Uncharacterized protein n=1 Tax=Microbacterium phage TinyTimothy TaxID=2583039 RepID=A0A4Y6ENV4_9CAUD|nr:hypothetical protein HWC33_gp46 [Microbacterium phage TinyTimothy]QDF16999.1 hypothetical protein SEA_TINYTIMOTHY_46 [Microbacterium phage TinyTimothy]